MSEEHKSTNPAATVDDVNAVAPATGEPAASEQITTEVAEHAPAPGPTATAEPSASDEASAPPPAADTAPPAAPVEAATTPEPPAPDASAGPEETAVGAETVGPDPEAAAPADAADASSHDAEPAPSESAEAASSQSASSDGKSRPRRENAKRELRELMELAIKYPEIGPPLARLASKIGHGDLAKRIVNMGLEADETTGMEFFAVAVDVARREGRFDDVFVRVDEAIDAFRNGEASSDDDANRLLHVIRQAFAVLLFDIGDVNGKPEWISSLGQRLPAISERFSGDAFFESLHAQTLWFSDREASEAAWERAVAVDDPEFAWNARGTWYKDAAQDFEASKKAYRRGLNQLKDSALLLHNLAQLLTDEAEKQLGDAPDAARGWLKEADELVRRALKKDARRGLRRYIHGTKDRVRKLVERLPEEQVDPPSVGDELKGRVVAVVPYGCFVTIRGGLKGLLHVSELAWERVEDPGAIVKVGDQIQVKVLSVETADDGAIRVGFSRKALLKKPDNLPETTKPERDDAKRGGGRGQQRNKGKKGRGNRDDRGPRRGKSKGNRGPRGHREDPKRQDGMGSLGELLLAKLEAAKGDDDSSDD